MSYKLNTELVNTAAVVEAAAQEITETAQEAVSNSITPIQIGELITFGNSGNFEGTHKGFIVWDDSSCYQNHNIYFDTTKI